MTGWVRITSRGSRAFPRRRSPSGRGFGPTNTTAYWTDHAATYRTAVAEPVAALAAALEERYGELHVFRPYRDVRFSKDTSPYKVSASMVAGSFHGSGALYVQVNTDGLRVAGGTGSRAP